MGQDRDGGNGRLLKSGTKKIERKRAKERKETPAKEPGKKCKNQETASKSEKCERKSGREKQFVIVEIGFKLPIHK